MKSDQPEPTPRFWEAVRADAEVLGTGPKGVGFFLAAALGLNKFSVVFLFRTACELKKGGPLRRALGSLAHRYNSFANACEISPGAQIGLGLHIPHPTGIIVGVVRAGSNLTLMQNVSVALRDRSLDHSDSDNYPTLGNSVAVGPGAVILGAVTIGDGARIGPNAVVTTDIPAGASAIAPQALVKERRLPRGIDKKASPAA